MKIILNSRSKLADSIPNKPHKTVKNLKIRTNLTKPKNTSRNYDISKFSTKFQFDPSCTMPSICASTSFSSFSPLTATMLSTYVKTL